MNESHPFASKNFRLFFAGQGVSLIGTWMQQVAMSWLVLTLTHSGTILGIVVAAQTIPVLLFGPYGGLLADRMNKRHLLIACQIILGSTSLIVGTLVATGAIRLWMVIVLAAVTGLMNAVANPTRQSFVSELVDDHSLRAAISMNSVLVNSSRAIGPAIAGVLIAWVGTQLCFFIDAASYLFVIAALLLMKTDTLRTSAPALRAKGQIREGVKYVRTVPRLFVPLLMMLLIGTFAYEFQVLLPLLASETFGGQAQTLGALTSAQGVGAILGGLYVARRGTIGILAITRGAALFCGAMVLAALAPSFPLELAALFIVGASSVQFLSVGNSTLQLTAAPEFRGRVMALWTMAFLGTTPVGGPLIGYIAEHSSPRFGLAIGAVACFVAAMLGVAVIKRHRANTPVQIPGEVLPTPINA